MPQMAHRCRCSALVRTLEEAKQNANNFYYSEDAPTVSAKKRTAIKASRNNNVIDVIGDIGYDESSLKAIKSKVDGLIDDDVDIIRFEVSTHGGDAFDGLAIYSYLISLNKRIEVLGHGFVGSAGTMILCASNYVTMEQTSMILVHRPYGMVVGDHEDLEQAAKGTKAMQEQYIKAYQAKTGRTVEEIEALMKTDQYISADQAKEFGLVDFVKKSKPTALAQAQHEEIEMSDKDKELGQDEQAKLNARITALEADLKVANAALKAAEDNKLDETAIREDERKKVNEETLHLAASKKEIDELGIDVAGDTVFEIQRNALNASGVNTDGFSDDMLGSLWQATKPILAKSKTTNDEIDKDFSSSAGEEFKTPEQIIYERQQAQFGGA